MWVPVLFSLITPIFFVVGTLFVKYLTSPSVGFDPFTLTFGYTGITNSLTLLVGILWFWSAENPVNKELFVRGFFSSIFDNLGLAFEDKATSIGPAGPISGLISLNSVLLTIYEAIYFKQVPNLLQ